MYPNYIENRKALGYEVLNDTSCGMKLVLIIDSTVILIRNLPSNAKNKTKRVILVIAFVSGGWFSNLASVEAIGLSVPPTAVVRVQPSHEHTFEVKIVPIVYKRLDKIRLIPTKEMMPLIYLNAQHVYVNEKILKRLRAGDLSSNLVLIAIGGVVYIILLNAGVDAFAILEQLGRTNAPRANPGFAPGGCPRSGSALEITRPTAMPHQEFVSLTKEARRGLSNSKDMRINHEGYPQLDVGFWQTQFKVGDHGAVHDLPYTLKSKGGTKTEKTDANTLKMMRSIVNMPNRDNVRWFVDGTYQGDTDREFEAIHIYDLDKRVIAVFKKSTGKFVTTCQLNPKEDIELKATGNFGGGKGWFSGQVKNLPPQQTAVNTFESDVTGITPISPMDENSSPGFTPTSSFESDIMGITPIDNSQLDNP